MPNQYEMPQWEGQEPKEFIPSTRIPNEIKKMSRQAAQESMVQGSEIKAKPFKVGDINFDEFPSEVGTLGIQRALTQQELNHLEADPRFKKMSQPEQRKAIREYIHQKDSLERPN